MKSTIAFVLLASSMPLVGQFEITSSTIDIGGGSSSGGPFVLRGTIGQLDASDSHASGDFN
ncbi:MAG: hypothetical protein GWO24_10950, partial [Akkermansiaceae bacterium]|nr:hypothetical protein [Akkermansiaceae bacterium]